MTDELYARIQAHVRENSVPPLGKLLPDGIPIRVVDDQIPEGEPELLEDRIRLHPRDFLELRRRMDETQLT